MNQLTNSAWRWCPRNVPSIAVLAATIACLGMTSGCSRVGPERVSIMGWVTLDGQKLQQGYITFIPTNGTKGPKAGAPVIDGEFEIARADGPMTGDLRVEIVADHDVGFELDDPETFNELAQSGQLPSNPIPAKYNEDSTLLVTTTVKGPNEFDFQLWTK